MAEKNKTVAFHSLYPGKSDFNLKDEFDNLFNYFSKKIYPRNSEIKDDDICYYAPMSINGTNLVRQLS